MSLTWLGPVRGGVTKMHIVDGMTPPEQDWGEMLITNIIYISPLAFQFYIFSDKAIEWPKFIFQL